ncbi:CBS domain-containing protein [Dialister sp.]|uniref:CBS domain-containing protein n=1 Tax=Dialister sp. TaxID=1955814 RepID=UPI003F0E2644
MKDQICSASEIMIPDPVTVAPETTIDELIHIFLREKQSLLPVVKGNELMGVVSKGDILYKKMYPYGPQYMDVLGAGAYYNGYGRYMTSFKKQLSTRVSDIMTRHVRCVSPNTPLEEIMILAVDGHIANIPVIEKPNLLVGLITRCRILQALDRF